MSALAAADDPPLSSILAEALEVLRKLTVRPDAAFRDGQDAAVVGLVER